MIYISGGITNVPDFIENFENAENYFKYKGYDVINPARINSMLPTVCNHDDYMVVSIAMLSLCDTIYLLK